MNNGYNASSIEILQGLAPVQKRPGMYTRTDTPNHLVAEVVDNSVDEALAGHARQIDVTLYADGTIGVADDGRGMPVDIHPERGVSGVEVILTTLHAGGKFSNKQYQYAGGLHGVGVSVVNALSETLSVTVYRDGKHYEMSFADGVRVAELQCLGKVARSRSGTVLRFRPAAQYFDSTTVDRKALITLLRTKAVLCPGLTLTLHDAANADEQHSWCYPDGLAAYFHERTAAAPLIADVVYHEQVVDEQGEIDVIFAWHSQPDTTCQESYVNLVPTPHGGTHVNGLRTGITDAIRDFCTVHELLPRGVRITPDDVFYTMSVILSIKVRDPQFVGQTKERLSSQTVATFVANSLRDRVSTWLHKHKAAVTPVIDAIIERARQRSRQAGKTAQRLSQTIRLPGKLADCQSNDIRVNEVFLVEGDSAGGSAKQARNKTFQAILPLRGKVLNAWEVDTNGILASQALADIAQVIGVLPGQDDLRGLRYGKICILADADSDGAHIATLLTAFFLRHFKALVSAGHVYVSQPPLYRIDIGKQVIYAHDKATCDATLQQHRQAQVLRFKGLGEMNPQQLRETTMDPMQRRLVQLRIDDDAPFSVFDMLLAKKRAADRRDWLQTHGDEAEAVA